MCGGVVLFSNITESKNTSVVKGHNAFVCVWTVKCETCCDHGIDFISSCATDTSDIITTAAKYTHWIFMRILLETCTAEWKFKPPKSLGMQSYLSLEYGEFVTLRHEDRY
ncbi:hypothetical protein LTR06_008918 [Exophiala xenobiotica]|nr:hypothetical protein LTR06_008918 [Exophiala xenobiotica]